MALSDWTVYKSQPGLGVSIEVASPIVDIGSLRVGNAGEGSVLNLTNLASTLYAPGLPKGKMRSIFKIDSANRTHVGFSYMQSTGDITPNTGNWYMATAQADAGQRRFRVERVNGGFGVGAVDVVLYAGSHPQWSFSTVFTMQIEWVIDIPGLGGVLHTLSTGTATDFSDLSVIYSAVESSGYLTSTFGEGPMALKWDTFGDTYSALYDNTSVYSIA
jgi:hypothetical protein